MSQHNVCLVDALFERVGLHRSGGKKLGNMPKYFDGPPNYLAALGLSRGLTADEKKMKTGLLDCATATAVQLPGLIRPPQLWVFPTSELERELKLEAPRKVQEFKDKTVSVEKKQNSKKVACENMKKARVANTTAGRVKRGLQEIDACHYVSDEATTLGGSMLDDALSRKRSRLSSSSGGGGGGGSGGSGDGGGGGGGGSGGNGSGGTGGGSLSLDDIHMAMSTSSVPRPLPANFLPVMSKLFSVFWEMEFDDPSVSHAFFAKIDAANCKLYGMETFAERASSLAVISERLKATEEMQSQGAHYQMTMLSSTRIQTSGAHSSGSPAMPYRSVEDFFTDFREMFDNVYRYFPHDGAVQLKAKELDAIFTSKWEAVKAQFV